MLVGRCEGVTHWAIPVSCLHPQRSSLVRFEHSLRTAMLPDRVGVGKASGEEVMCVCVGGRGWLGG